MRITHVIRGDDHVNNTPRQINIMRALGATPPAFAHLPTVLTPDGDKLSKRHGAKSVLQYRDDGYLPEAVVNYLARLGWSHGDDEIFTRDELVTWFDLDGLSSSPGRFDPDKLAWVNQEHMKRMPLAELGQRLRPFLARAGYSSDGGPAASAVAALLRERTSTLVEMADAAAYFYRAPVPAPDLVAQHVTPATRPALAELDEAFATVEWTREAIGALVKSTAAKHGLKPPQLMMALRTLVAGTTQTPAIDAVLAAVGREATRTRMAAGLLL
jgi:glutamyl-tRNA synthetase